MTEHWNLKWHLPLVEAARATWPRSDWPHWHKYCDQNSVKYATKDSSRLTPAAAELLRLMAQLSVPEGWFPDLDLHGAGMHWIPQGGHLARHLDGQVHPLTGWHRQGNTILFLDRCEGGELLIDGQPPITPEPGRLAMFTADQWHEVRPVTNGQRRTLSLFWWSIEGDPTAARDRAEFSPST